MAGSRQHSPHSTSWIRRELNHLVWQWLAVPVASVNFVRIPLQMYAVGKCQADDVTMPIVIQLYRQPGNSSVRHRPVITPRKLPSWAACSEAGDWVYECMFVWEVLLWPCLPETPQKAKRDNRAAPTKYKWLCYYFCPPNGNYRVWLAIQIGWFIEPYQLLVEVI